MQGYKSTKELARATGYAEITVYSWLRGGRVKAEKVGRTWAIPDAEFERVVRECVKRNES